MNTVVIYIHGQGGSPEEAEHYRSLFPECDVVGMNYCSETPWEAKEEFPKLFDELSIGFSSVYLIANSIGAFYAMNSLSNKNIKTAFFISPVVNMREVIENMMAWANVSHEELQSKGIIKTSFGPPLSWEYLSYVKTTPYEWHTPTHILYGSKDYLTSVAAITQFAYKTISTLTVMENGEHWFHTEEQMIFLDNWIKSIIWKK